MLAKTDSVAFVVIGVPVSLQSKSSSSRHEWKSEVREAARSAVQEDERLEYDDLRCAIVYFHADDCEPDIDNIVKPILDGASGVAYGDDRQFAQVTVRRTSLRGPLLLRGSPSLAILRSLERALADGSDFIYVFITNEPIDHEELP